MSDPETDQRPEWSPLATLSLLAAPVTAIIARLLWVPYEDDPEEIGTYLAKVADAPARSALGAFLMILSAVLLVPAVITLAAIVRQRTPRLARWSVAMTIIGAFGMAVLCTVALVANHLARQPDRAGMTDLWDGFVSDPKGEIVFLAVLVGVVGFILLAVGLYRSRQVPKGAAVLVGIGGATTLFTSGGPVRPFLLTAAVLALAGFGWVAASLHHPPVPQLDSVAAMSV